MSLTLDGRDKITKVVQYASRFLGWYFESIRMGNPTAASTARGISAAFASGRKTYRLGRWLTEYVKIRGVLEKAKGRLGVDVVLKVGRYAGLAGFWISDNAALIMSAALIGPAAARGHTKDAARLKSVQKRIQAWGMKSMLVSAMMGLVLSVQGVVRHRMELETDTGVREGDERRRQAEAAKHFILLLAVVKSISDFASYGNNVGRQKISEGTQCVFSLISAATVIYNKFPDAPLSPQRA